jgi:hypothetical protein
VQQYGQIETMPPDVREAAGESGSIAEVRRIYRQPAVTDTYTVQSAEPDRDGIVDFLCAQRQFSPSRVTAALDRAFPAASLF